MSSLWISIKKSKFSPSKKKSTKHKQLPNGFGQISEIKNRNLRKPFRAMVSVGTQEIGLNHNHKPHDGRVQFATSAKKYCVNEYALKYMMGHAINDITESVYTKREPNWLREEIEKIK